MEADAAIAALLAQPQEVRFEESAPPRLRLVVADGSTTTWTGEATAQTRYGGEGETVFMEVAPQRIDCRSEEHTSELQSLMRTSYAVFCLKKQKNTTNYT